MDRRTITGTLPGLTGETPDNVLSDYNAANNQIGAFTYDARGNVAATPTHSMWYDGENRQTSMAMGSVSNWFAYDGENRRIGKIYGASSYTVYVYDAFGRLALEDTTGAGTVEHIYGLGHVATESGSGRQYYTNDQLGSTRRTT
jgi:hypothetical protein